MRMRDFIYFCNMDNASVVGELDLPVSWPLRMSNSLKLFLAKNNVTVLGLQDIGAA